MRDREVNRDAESDEAQQECRRYGPARDRLGRSTHLMPMAFFAAMTPELVQTFAGKFLVNVQKAAVW